MYRVHLPGRGRSVTFLAAAAFVVALAAPAAVLGHAELATMTPANGTTVTAAPTEIVGTFTEALDPSKSSLVLVTSGGAQVASGGVVAADDAKKMTLTLPSLAEGAYEIRWTTASAVDGDIARGTTTFIYAQAPTVLPSASTAASATSAASAAATPSPSVAVTVAPSPSGSGQPASTSTSDLIIPIVVAVILIAGLGYWLLRGRARPSGTP